MKDPVGRTDQLELGKERERQQCVCEWKCRETERESGMCVRDGVMKRKRRRLRERDGKSKKRKGKVG